MSDMQHTRPHTQAGFSLIEVLIAMLVLSLGLLGIAGLQMQGTRYVYDAHLKSIALIQVQDMADRMRTNQPGVRAGDYSQVSGMAEDPGCTAQAAGCTPAQLATYDQFVWNTANSALLPSGQGVVSCTDIDAATTTVMEIGSVCQLTVMWDGNRSEATGTDCDPTNADDLKCVRIRMLP